MLSAEVELAHLDARHWANWWRLLVPPRVLAAPSWALAILDAGKPIKLVIANTGSIEPPDRGFTGVGEAGLTAWARALGVAAVIAIDRAAIGPITRDIESALRLEQDLVEQGLVALRVLKRHAGRGVWTEPPLLDILPAPSYQPIQRTFDLLIPDRTSLIAYVIDDDRSAIHASIIAVKEGGDVTRVATHRAIADLVPESTLARTWAPSGKSPTQASYRRVLAAVEERFAKPSVALFLERATLMRVITGPGDQLARELNAKRVVIDPAPPWLLGLLGGATVAAMAGRAATALAGMLPQRTRDAAAAVANRARDAMKDSGAHPFALLGFDPIELWSRVKHYYRQ